MERRKSLVWIILLLVTLVHTVTQEVHFKRKTLYVGPDEELALEAQCSSLVNISKVTWEFTNAEGGPTQLATSNEPPSKSGMTLEDSNFTLRIKHVENDTYGTYKIIVIWKNGDTEENSTEVLKMEMPPKVTIALQCNLLEEKPHWDKSVFQWLKDGVTYDKANLSADGSQLFLTGEEGHNYTCIVSSSLGKSIVHQTFGMTCNCHSNWITVLWISLIFNVFFGCFCLCKYCRPIKGCDGASGSQPPGDSSIPLTYMNPPGSKPAILVP